MCGFDPLHRHQLIALQQHSLPHPGGWRTAAEAREVRAAAAQAGGHATLIRGADKSDGVFTPVSDVLMRIHQGLKQAFDPARIFNPGRLYAEL